MRTQPKTKQAMEPGPAAAVAALEPAPRTNYLRLVMRESGASTMLALWHPAALRRNWPGVAICIAVALSATFVSTAYGGPQLLYALFFGLAFHFLSLDPVCRPGIEFCSKTLLRTGVALLGARITFGQVTAMGMRPIVIVLLAVASTILFGCLLARLLGRTRSEGLLSGGAVGICGASAALAISAVLPQNKENEQFTLLTVVGVTTLSTLAMILYPLLVHFFGLDATAAGIFIGGTIHDVAQVVGAGYLVSNHTGDVATLVKLTRVACLVPVVVMVSIMYRSRDGVTEFDTPPLVPFFLIGFIWLLLANSFHLIPQAASTWINTASRACLVIAIAALGVKTSFQSLASLGWRPVLMLAGETVWIALLVLAALTIIR
jgi:uncharacterized integral membrane protein (TIGR00698 family)